MPELPPSFIADVERAQEPARLALLRLESERYPWHAAAKLLIDRKLTAEPYQFGHAILFTGHMIDSPTRPNPRFPATAEPRARAAIRDSLRTLLAANPLPTIGLAGGASGGDLLFHEACASLGIATVLRLTLPEPDFLAASVAPAKADWVARFHSLAARLGPAQIEVLGESRNLPAWMDSPKDYDVWQRTNLWLVEEARLLAPRRTLLALWDGQPGDGPGGTQHLVEAAPRYGIEVAPIISTSSLSTNG